MSCPDYELADSEKEVETSNKNATKPKPCSNFSFDEAYWRSVFAPFDVK